MVSHQGTYMKKLRNDIMRNAEFLTQEQIKTATPEELVHSHIPLIFSTISQYAQTTYYDDLFQECCICLLTAAKTFDSSKGTSFTSYVKQSLTGAIIKYIDEYRMPLRVFTTKSLKKIRFNIHKYIVNDELTDTAIEQMCSDLNVTREQITDYTVRASTQGKSYIDSSEDETDIYDTIADESYEPTLVLSRIQRELALEHALSVLNERESKIIQERYMFDEEKASLSDLSSKLGISQQRVSQIEHAAIKKMKKQLEQY